MIQQFPFHTNIRVQILPHGKLYIKEERKEVSAIGGESKGIPEAVECANWLDQDGIK